MIRAKRKAFLHSSIGYKDVGVEYVVTLFPRVFLN